MSSVANKKFLFLLIIFSMLIFISPGFASELVLQKNVMRLSIEEGKLMVLKNNLDIAIHQISPLIETSRITSKKGSFDPLISGSFKREDSSTPLSTRSSVAAGGRSTVKSEVYSLSTGASGKSSIGTKYSIGFEDIWTQNTFNSFDAEYDAFAGIRITQPLMKDAGRDVNNFDIVIARKNRDISISDLRQHTIDTLADFKKAYWNLVLAFEDLKVKEEAIKLAESLLDLNRKRLKADVSSPLEVTHAEAGVASRQEDLIVAKNSVREKENALKKLISNDIYSLRNTDIMPSSTPVVSEVISDLDRNFREGIENRPDYSKVKTEIDKNNITVKYAKNQKFPAIDLEASYGFNGLGNSFSDSIDSMNKNDEWSLGIIATFPIGNRIAKGDLRIAELKAQQELLNLKKLEQEILVEIDNAMREVETNMQRIKAAKISNHLAEESLLAEETKLREGLSTSHDVLEFQEELAQARSREISAIIDYNKSLVELSRVKGTILQEEGISIADDTITLVRR